MSDGSKKGTPPPPPKISFEVQKTKLCYIQKREKETEKKARQHNMVENMVSISMKK